MLYIITSKAAHWFELKGYTVPGKVDIIALLFYLLILWTEKLYGTWQGRHYCTTFYLLVLWTEKLYGTWQGRHYCATLASSSCTVNSLSGQTVWSMGMLLHQPLLQSEQRSVWMMIRFVECEVASIGTGSSISVLFEHSRLDSQLVAIPTEDFVHTWIDSPSGFQLLLTHECNTSRQ
jgi:hypothetical protein